MLETLSIKNIAIIDNVEITFQNGLNVLSGETGAGKSIIIEAIALLLGSRASSELLRSGCDEAVVQGVFNISEIPWLPRRLEKLGFTSHEDASCLLIKRIVHKTGKHRIYINGELATLSILQELCEGLIDLCSQHEHQSLTKSNRQLDLLDRYGGALDLAKKMVESHRKLQGLKAESQSLQQSENERARRADFLKFQIEELRTANLEAGEDDKLHVEKQLLQSAEVRVQAAESARKIIEGDEEGVLIGIRSALQKIRSLVQLDEQALPLQEGLDRALAETEEVSIALNRYLGSIDLNFERLEFVQDRLALIANLRRKYGATVDLMIETLARIEEELNSLGDSEERLVALNLEIQQALTEMRKIGKKLSSIRHKYATVLSDSVTQELKDLNMKEARFKVDLSTEEKPEQWNASGAETIQFLVRTNRGEPERPLGKIASGGELSRLLLAIRRVISDKGGIGVYLFDEIDAGIGGQTAFQVGKKLKSVASYNQVICITHLPQVASFADHHLVVRKATHGKRTKTEVIHLSQAERKSELARMLGGPELTRKSLENAAELLELAKV